MPFIINGQKVNKPIYKGATLNAIHVWLQNHWTGTANASNSILSQDGTVIATNLAPNPKPVSNGFQTFNFNNWSKLPTISDTDQGMLIDGTEITDTNIGARMVGLSIPGPGDYHLHGRVRTDGTWNIDFAIAYYDYANIPPSSLVDGVADIDFHVDSTANGELQLKCPAGSTAVWDNIGIYTAADWQAMQALGITWFDGTTYTRRSINN